MPTSEVLSGYLSDNTKIDQAIAATIAGTTTITSAAFDMTGYEHVMVIATFGTPAANNTVTLQTGATSTTASTVATMNDATLTPLILDCQNVPLQFVKVQCARGTSSTIDQVTIIRYGARAKAVTQAATEKVATFNAPS